MTVSDLIERLQRFNLDDPLTVARVSHKRGEIPARLCREVQSVDTVRVGDVRHVAVYVGHVIDRRLLR